VLLAAVAEDWSNHIIADDAGLTELLRTSRRIAVLGIKPESRAQQPGHFVPRYLQAHGYEIVPVPVYYPDVTEMLGAPVWRSLASIPGAVDLVEVFRKSADLPPHVPDILAKQPRAVWFQSGIRDDAVARQLAEAGIRVVQDRCMMVEHERLIR
jgi:hypothetical protein